MNRACAGECMEAGMGGKPAGRQVPAAIAGRAKARSESGYGFAAPAGQARFGR